MKKKIASWQTGLRLAVTHVLPPRLALARSLSWRAGAFKFAAGADETIACN